MINIWNICALFTQISRQNRVHNFSKMHKILGIKAVLVVVAKIIKQTTIRDSKIPKLSYNFASQS